VVIWLFSFIFNDGKCATWVFSFNIFDGNGCCDGCAANDQWLRLPILVLLPG
jgi:hypothetical protein